MLKAYGFVKSRLEIVVTGGGGLEIICITGYIDKLRYRPEK